MFDKMKPETKSVIQKLIDGMREVNKSEFYKYMINRDVHPNVTFFERKYGVSVFQDCDSQRITRGVNISFYHDYFAERYFLENE